MSRRGADPDPSRWARRLLIAIHVPLVAIPVLFTLLGVGVAARYPAAAVTIALGPALTAVQLRHSLAAARGVRPRHWPWTLLLLAGLVYLPMLWIGITNWISAQVLLAASVLMLLRGPARLLFLPPLLATQTAMALQPAYSSHLVYALVSLPASITLFAVGLYGAARLVRVLDELHQTRTELAELAVGRERLRVSRDLHDLLGQGLSAVSLKAELADHLLNIDAQAAHAEIESLTGVARTALRDVRAISSNQRSVSVATEAGGAARLLAAAGIHARIDVTLPALEPAAEQVLAWAIREGVTNVLRHSEARTCTITARPHDGPRWRLEIVNDRAHPPTGTGNGLAGLTQRAAELSGSVSAGHTGDGGFRLRVDIPGDAL